VEIFIPDLPSFSLTKWALSHIGIYEDYAPLWNVEKDTSSWDPHNLMHKNNLWVISPGVAIQGSTAAIMTWVEFPWDSSHLFLIPRIQQRSFGRVNKHVEFIGQFKEVNWGMAQSPLVPFVIYYPPHLVRFFKPNSDDGMQAPQWVLDQVEHLCGLLGLHHSWRSVSLFLFGEDWICVRRSPPLLVGTNTTLETLQY
jgi:hypothetical protein